MTTAIPKKYLCPRTQKIMREPMLASDGLSYEKEAISSGLNDYPIDALATISASLHNTVPNKALREEIARFLDKHPELLETVYLPVVWIYEIIEAIHFDNLEKLANLVKLDKRLLTYHIYEDYTPFHYACEIGSLKATLQIFNCFANDYSELIFLSKPQHWKPVHLNNLLSNISLPNSLEAFDTLMLLGASPEDDALLDSPRLIRFSRSQSPEFPEFISVPDAVPTTCRRNHSTTKKAARGFASLSLQDNHERKRKIAKLEAELFDNSVPSSSDGTSYAAFFKPEKKAGTSASQHTLTIC